MAPSGYTDQRQTRRGVKVIDLIKFAVFRVVIAQPIALSCLRLSLRHLRNVAEERHFAFTKEKTRKAKTSVREENRGRTKQHRVFNENRLEHFKRSHSESTRTRIKRRNEKSAGEKIQLFHAGVHFSRTKCAICHLQRGCVKNIQNKNTLYSEKSS